MAETDEAEPADADAAEDLQGATRYAFLISYDGAPYAGWQYQTNGLSIQQVVEEAAGKLTGAPVRVLAAGRTDSGVHALGQVASFKVPHGPPGAPRRVLAPSNIVMGMNHFLPPTIRVLGARIVPESFDPRKDARLRHYRYWLIQGGSPPAFERGWRAWTPSRMDWDLLSRTLALYQGQRDFAAFRSVHCRVSRTVLDLERVELRLFPRLPFGDPGELGVLAQFDFFCRSFLHSMVRMLVGTALEVGRGKMKIESVSQMLAQGRRIDHAPVTAPACGLCLLAVGYPEELGLWASAEALREQWLRSPAINISLAAAARSR